MALTVVAKSNRLSEIAVEIRTTWARVRRDTEATRRLLEEARTLCRARRENFDQWCLSGKFGISRSQIYNLLGGHTSSHRLHRVEVGILDNQKFYGDEPGVKAGSEPEPVSPYQVTPPDLLKALYDEWDFTDDVCPRNRDPRYDGLTAVWGARNYCNPPFQGVGPWVRKAIAEFKLGKLVVMVLPYFQEAACFELRQAGATVRDIGAVRWLSLEDGSPKPGPARQLPACALYILDPNLTISDNRKFHSDTEADPEIEEILNISMRNKKLPMEVGCWEKERSGVLMEAGVWPRTAQNDVLHYQEKSTTTCEWYSPKYLFSGMNVRFDLDPASPGLKITPWIPADRCFTLRDDGLCQDWGKAFVWLNPPFSKDRLARWVRKFIGHGNGVILVPERTSTVWYQEIEAASDLVIHLSKKIPFIDADGTPHHAFPIGTHLLAIGDQGVAALINAHRAGLGLLSRKFIP